MPRKWNLPLTYPPKIEAVKKGECTQTIRIINKTEAHPNGVIKEVGDLVRFFTWSGKPYHSKRIWVVEDYMPITYVNNPTIISNGIVTGFTRGDVPEGVLDTGSFITYKLWLWNELDWLAALDGIVPPTGEALRDVLISKNGKIPAQGIESQIIRWSPCG